MKSIIVSKSMGVAGSGIEPASGGATAQEQPSLRYHSLHTVICNVSDTTSIWLDLLRI